MSTNYGAPYYSPVTSTYVQIFSSATCSPKTSTHVYPLGSDHVSHPYKRMGKNYNTLYAHKTSTFSIHLFKFQPAKCTSRL